MSLGLSTNCNITRQWLTMQLDTSHSDAVDLYPAHPCMLCEHMTNALKHFEMFTFTDHLCCDVWWYQPTLYTYIHIYRYIYIKKMRKSDSIDMYMSCIHAYIKLSSPVPSSYKNPSFFGRTPCAFFCVPVFTKLCSSSWRWGDHRLRRYLGMSIGASHQGISQDLGHFWYRNKKWLMDLDGLVDLISHVPSYLVCFEMAEPTTWAMVAALGCLEQRARRMLEPQPSMTMSC